MAGILNPKTRFLDTFVTQIGRDQLAHGELRFEYATFSDYGTFYEGSKDDPEVAEDSSNRIFFQPVNRPQDQVIPEFDDDGHISFPAGDFDITNGALLLVSGTSGTQLMGTALVQSASIAITDCSTSFSEMQPLRSEELNSLSTGFEMSVDTAEFPITNQVPIPSTKLTSMQLSNVESLWQDKKLAHVPNYQYLPPQQKGTGNQLREWPRLEQPGLQSWADLAKDLGADSPSGETGCGDPITAKFTSTSRENNLVCQVFEVTSGSMNKLRMIDFGEFEDLDPDSPGRHVFFAGKLLVDDYGQDTFINLFTVVFD